MRSFRESVFLETPRTTLNEKATGEDMTVIESPALHASVVKENMSGGKATVKRHDLHSTLDLLARNAKNPAPAATRAADRHKKDSEEEN